MNRDRGRLNCGRAPLPTKTRTKVLLLECCRILKLEGAVNKDDCVFVAADYNELLFSFFGLRIFFSWSVQHNFYSILNKELISK